MLLSKKLLGNPGVWLEGKAWHTTPGSATLGHFPLLSAVPWLQKRISWGNQTQSNLPRVCGENLLQGTEGEAKELRGRAMPHFKPLSHPYLLIENQKAFTPWGTKGGGKSSSIPQTKLCNQILKGYLREGKTEQSRTEQNKPKQSKPEQNKPEQSKAEQNKAKPNRTNQNNPPPTQLKTHFHDTARLHSKGLHRVSALLQGKLSYKHTGVTTQR